MLDLTTIKEGSKIEYIGDSFAYGGTYTVITSESTYKNVKDCPKDERGTLLIIEFMNDGTPMYIPLTSLDKNQWKNIK